MSMPQTPHLSGLADFTDGCIGQEKGVAAGGDAGEDACRRPPAASGLLLHTTNVDIATSTVNNAGMIFITTSRHTPDRRCSPAPSNAARCRWLPEAARDAGTGTSARS